MERNSEQKVVNPSVIRDIQQYFIQLNLYKEKTNFSISEQLIATRLNLAFFLLSFFILLMVHGLAPQTYLITISSPSLSQFQQLTTQYPSTLSCPCSQVNILYNTFLSFTPRYHQICSSEFISQSWISSLFSPNITRYFPLDFRTSASSQFQTLAFLCRTTSTFVSNALSEFGLNKLLSTHVLSSINFDAQNAVSIQHLQTTTIANVLRMDGLLTLNLVYNNLKSSLLTNYYVVSVAGQRFYITYTGHYLFPDYKNMSDSNEYCSCDNTVKCGFPSGIYQSTERNIYYYSPNNYSIYSVPGVFAGCLPHFSLLQSTLECFYDTLCLNVLGTFGIDTSSRRPLNRSISSRYSITTTIETMFNQLFIEEWHDQSNFTSYFLACAPQSCSYRYTERINPIYIITNMIGLLGGLMMACHLIVLILVQYILRRVLRKYYPHLLNPQEDVAEQTINSRSLRQTLFHYWNLCLHTLRNVNIYKRSIVLPEIKDQLLATHICLVLLLIGVVILTIYSSVISRSKTATIVHPTRDQFEEIYAKSSSTLSCPCTQVSTSYSAMISIQPRYHQICTSDFIRDDKWLLYFELIPYVAFRPNYTYNSLDFRNNAGSSIFRIMRILCRFANETVTNSLIVFNNTRFVSNEPLTNQTFQIRTSSLIAEFQRQTLGSFLSLFGLIQLMIEDHHFHVYTDTNIAHISYVINNTWSVRFRPRAYPRETNNNQTCNCLISNQCVRPQGFYCQNVACRQQASFPNQSVPGLMVSCFPFNSLSLSNFECFYNQSCIQMLYDWRLFELSDQFYPLALNVTPLDPHLSSRFSPTTKIETILSSLLIEDWTSKTNVSAHYEQCSPKVCTYTYTERFETIYVITTIIGLFGGLFLVLKWSVPFFIRILLRCMGQVNPTNQVVCQRPAVRQPSLLIRTRQSLASVDIYDDQLDHSIWATRVYFLLFFLTFSIISIFTSLSRETESQTILFPSQSTYEFLHQRYSVDSLSCPCQQSSIPYKTFLSIAAHYHQVCSSAFISSSWWTLINSRGNEPFLLRDQPLLGNHFRMLASFCKLSQQTVKNGIDLFLSNDMVSVQPLTRSTFENQIQSSLNVLIQQTSSTFIQTLEYIINTFRSNQLEHLFLSDWMLSFTTASENYIIATIPLSYNNNTCTCATSLTGSCWWSLNLLLMNGTIIHLPGLVGGCLPIDGLRQSTLECLADPLCLAIFPSFINGTTITNIPPALNISVNTRFPLPITKIGTLIDHLFVEEWFNTTNYSAYYESCSPHACYYTYSTRLNILYKVTSILGLYGGTTITLRFLVAHVFRIINRLRLWWRARH